MAYREYVQKAIDTGKSYDELPAKVKAAVPLPEWKARVRDLCIQQGRAWDRSQARGVCGEQDYYEQLLATYKDWGRLYPYHLSDYLARVLRVTPFRYYSDLLFLCLKEERSYDRIPNFTAADALRLTGVGRNEYIAALNACRSKRLLWRVSRGQVAREALPQAPPSDIRMEGWWRVAVVNVGESEFRELSGEEAALLRAAADPPCPLPVSAFDAGLLQRLYKRSLVYLDIPVGPDDRFHIPPLEGFVSNKTSESGDTSVDPFEPLMYRLFLANSSRLNQAQLADILGTDLEQLLAATALAVRLGFATRIPPAASADAAGAGGNGVEELWQQGGPSAPASAPGAAGSASAAAAAAADGAIPDALLEDSAAAAAGAAAAGAVAVSASAAAAGGAAPAAAAPAGWAGAAGAGGGAGGGGSQGAVAVVVDAEATSFLMMGALSAGLKRHSVSLFEGGRVSGQGVMDELIAELQASAAAGAMFEGEDMAQLMRVIRSLGILLEAVRAAAAAQGHTVELLRQESFEGLDPLSAAKVLSATYTAIVPISPLPGHTLPRLLCQQLLQHHQHQHQQHALGHPLTSSSSSSRSLASAGATAQAALPAAAPFPAFFGPPSPEADSPWLQLALYAAARAGPTSLVFVAGSRVWRLPPQLQGCTHALLWGWGPAVTAPSASAAGSGGSKAAAEARPLLVEGSSLLCTLNELLSRTAVMVQPLVRLEQLPPEPAAAAAAAEDDQQQQQRHLVRFVDVPLPLCPLPVGEQGQQQQQQQHGSSAAHSSLAEAAAAGDGPGSATPSPAAATATAGGSAWDPFAALLEAAVPAAAPAAPAPAAAAAAAAGQPPPPLPATPTKAPADVRVQAVERTGCPAGRPRELALPGQVAAALAELQLSGAVGWLRLVKLPPPAGAAAGGPAAGAAQPWLPLSINLGVPLSCPTLCQLVCANLAQQGCLTSAGQAAWTAAQQQLQQQMAHHLSSAAAAGSGGQGSSADLGHLGLAGSISGTAVEGGGVELPPRSLLFDGHSLLPVDLSTCMQGVQLW